MDRDAVEQEIRRLVPELIQQQEIAEHAGRQAAGIRNILGIYVGWYPDLEAVVEALAQGVQLDSDDDGDPHRPRGAAAVRVILQENIQRPFTVSEMVEALRHRDWLPVSENPANAVRTALERLSNNVSETDVWKSKYDGIVNYSYDPDRERGVMGDGYDEEPF